MLKKFEDSIIVLTFSKIQNFTNKNLYFVNVAVYQGQAFDVVQ